MARQFWVGEFFVDLSRNQISQLGQSQTLPPKALQVLTLLAKNPGEVVTYDELLQAVWPNSVVTPNTLQRCVLQLRKALGETSKEQSIIKNHTKQGYSLECAVSWAEKSQDSQQATKQPSYQTEKSPTEKDTQLDKQETEFLDLIALDPDSPEKNEATLAKLPEFDDNKKVPNPWHMMAFGILVFCIMWVFRNHDQNPQIEFGDVRYLTATDDKEYAANYSPDGQFILFRRYLNLHCINHIWAKNVDTLQEFQLTSVEGTYSGHNLSPDGKTLAFIQAQDCVKPVEQNTCYSLMTLDFEAALSRPQAPKKLLNCLSSSIKRPIWVDHSHIALQQKQDGVNRLVLYSINEKLSRSLYPDHMGQVLSFDWSKDKQLYGVISQKSDGTKHIEMLSPKGQIKSSHAIEIPPDAPRHLRIVPQFIPDSDQMVFGHGGKVYSLTKKGKIQLVPLPFEELVGMPYLHPEKDSMLLIRGQFDSDIIALELPEETTASDSSQPGVTIDYRLLHRSTGLDDEGFFHPDGKGMAMVSNRTGVAQVWRFANNDGSDSGTVVSDFPKDSYIESMLWDDKGEKFLVLAVSELYLLSKRSQMKYLAFHFAITKLFHWDSEQRSVLALALIQGKNRFVSLNLDTMEHEILNNKNVHWATQTDNGTVIFIDGQDKFWKQGPVEDEPITELNGIGWAKKRFVVQNDKIYSVNRDKQLWSFDLDSKEFTTLGSTSDDLSYLTDIQGKHILARVLVVERKEVIELDIVR